MSEYSSKNIQILEGLEAVRKRPGMYIGGTGFEGLHHLMKEIVDNAIDEAMAGYCTHISITLLHDGGIAIEDNGRGIPVDVHEKTGKSALETVLTVLHAGGKFGGDASGYKISGGLHGVGASVVNALSSRLIAEVFKDGKHYRQSYAYGKAESSLEVLGTSQKRGTRILFYPDTTIFETVVFDREYILAKLRQQAFLTKGITLTLFDEREEPHFSYRLYFEGGVRSYVRSLNIGKSVLTDPVSFERQLPECMVEIAFQYTESYNETVLCFANNIINPGGGTHLTGFKSALTRVINAYARNKEFLKEKDLNFTSDDIREGLTAVISVKLEDAQFEGQTKDKLGSPQIRGAVESSFADFLERYLEENPQTAKSMILKASLAQQARIAARIARDTVIRKGALEGMTLPGKLADCSSKNPEDSELFIVEGDSAGGSAKQGRDRHSQAILPLKGKILNSEKARLDKLLGNEEVRNIITALGTGVSEVFDITKLRYHKIVIMTDADVDGAHIRTLLLTLFYRYFPEIIDHGHLYIAQPPLFKVSKGKQHWYIAPHETIEEVVGEDISFAISDDESGKDDREDKEALLEAGFRGKELESELETVKPKKSKYTLQRYKGLGEMNPEQLWETTMDPTKRTMLKITVADAEKASAIFDALMGDEVLHRKKFIQHHAKDAKDIDVV